MLGKSSKDQESEGGTRATTVKGPGGASLISRDLRILGDCVSDGRLRIEGTVTGDVTAAGLEVARTGSVEGDVTVSKGGGYSDTIVIDGSVKGAVRGARVEVG
ncbi:MAG: polymer-forming cytoskeletal protein, partial [Longimicrobiales bacterium]